MNNIQNSNSVPSAEMAQNQMLAEGFISNIDCSIKSTNDYKVNRIKINVSCKLGVIKDFYEHTYFYSGHFEIPFLTADFESGYKLIHSQKETADFLISCKKNVKQFDSTDIVNVVSMKVDKTTGLPIITREKVDDVKKPFFLYIENNDLKNLGFKEVESFGKWG